MPLVTSSEHGAGQTEFPLEMVGRCGVISLDYKILLREVEID